jgi:hypothetical protein
MYGTYVAVFMDTVGYVFVPVAIDSTPATNVVKACSALAKSLLEDGPTEPVQGSSSAVNGNYVAVVVVVARVSVVIVFAYV